MVQKPVYPVIKVIRHLKKSPELGHYSNITLSFFNFFLLVPIYLYGNPEKG
jgi:hypothetical protein